VSDFNLSNQSRTAFRGELNAILALLVSNLASATEPDPTFGGMFWADTSGAEVVLRLRNALNTAWITVATLQGGVLRVEAAAAALLLRDTAAAATRDTVRAQLTGDRLAIALLDSSGTLVETIHDVTVNDDGAVRHGWRVGSAERLVLDAAGLRFDGEQIATLPTRLPDVIVAGAGGGPGTLNLATVIRNEGGFATPASSRVTLPAGSYLFMASAQVRLNTSQASVNNASVALRDVTADEYLQIVANARGNNLGVFSADTRLLTHSFTGADRSFELHGSRDNTNWGFDQNAVVPSHDGVLRFSQQLSIWRIS